MSTRAAQIELLLDTLVDPTTGSICSGYTAYFYAAGTSTAKNVWTEKEKTNPFTTYTLDSGGKALLYGDGIYKILVKNLAGTTVLSLDNLKIQANTYSVVQKIGTYTATKDDDVIICNGTFTLNLDDVANFEHLLQVFNVGSGAITVDPYSTQTVGGASTYGLAAGDQIILTPDSASNTWRVTPSITIASRTELTAADSGDALLIEDVSETGDNLRHITVHNLLANGATAFDRVYFLSQYDSLADAITAISTTKARLVIDTTGSISADLTIPSNVTLSWYYSGCEISIADTKTLTINGPVEAGFFKLFTQVSTGVVVFGANIDRAVPQWLGAVGNGSTDDSTAINATLTAASTNKVPVYLPPATYDIAGTSISLPTGSRLYGAGQTLSILQKSTQNSSPALTVAASSKTDVRIHDLGLTYSLSAFDVSGAHAAIIVDTATRIDIERVRVTGRFYVGIYILDSKQVNIVDCRVQGAVNRAYYAAGEDTGGLQNVVFQGCYANGYEVGETTAYTDYGFNTNCFGTGTAQNIKFIGCTAENMESQGFASSERVSFVSFTDCIASNVTTGPGFLFQLANTYANQWASAVNCVASFCETGFYVADSNYVLLANCTAISCEVDGFLVNGASTYISMSNCQALSNGTSEVGSGFQIANTVNSAKCIGCSATSNYDYGFLVGASTANCIILGCAADANGTDYSIAGTGTINEHNI